MKDDERTDGAHDGQERPQFRIRKDRPQLPPGQSPPDEEKVAAGQDHRYHSRYFQERIVIAGEIKRCRTAACRSRSHSLVDGFEHIHPRRQIKQRRNDGDPGIYFTGLQRRISHTADHRAEGDALMGRQGHAETAADLGYYRDQHDDEIQAAHPFHETVPEQEGMGFCLSSRQKGNTCRRIGGNAFKKRIGRREHSCPYVRHHADQPQQEPDGQQIPCAFSHTELFFMLLPCCF